MKSSRVASFILCAVTGVVGAIIYLSGGDVSTHERRMTLIETPSRPAVLAAPRHGPEDQLALVPESMSTDPSSELDKTNIQVEAAESARLKLVETAKRLTDYAASFAPGVYGEELLQGIATMAIKPSEDAVDGWSAEMEYRLRLFFGSQPEVLSSSRVGITCRALQCNLQIAAIRSSAQESEQDPDPKKMIDRLKKEDWYGQNFAATSAPNTMWSPQLTYESWTLRKRN
jgi:hypothetical protein